MGHVLNPDRAISRHKKQCEECVGVPMKDGSKYCPTFISSKLISPWSLSLGGCDIAPVSAHTMVPTNPPHALMDGVHRVGVGKKKKPNRAATPQAPSSFFLPPRFPDPTSQSTTMDSKCRNRRIRNYDRDHEKSVLRTGHMHRGRPYACYYSKYTYWLIYIFRCASQLQSSAGTVDVMIFLNLSHSRVMFSST